VVGVGVRVGKVLTVYVVGVGLMLNGLVVGVAVV